MTPLIVGTTEPVFFPSKQRIRWLLSTLCLVGCLLQLRAPWPWYCGCTRHCAFLDRAVKGGRNEASYALLPFIASQCTGLCFCLNTPGSGLCFVQHNLFNTKENKSLVVNWNMFVLAVLCFYGLSRCFFSKIKLLSVAPR